MANRISAQEDKLASQLTGGFDGDLLPEHGADGEFKSIPASRRAKSRPCGNQRSECLVLGQMRGNGADVSSDIEQVTDTCDNRVEARARKGTRMVAMSALRSGA